MKKQKRYKTTPEQRIKAGQQSVLFHERAKGEQTAVTHSELKRLEMQNVDNMQLSKQQPTPVDSQPMPDPAKWSTVRPSDPELSVCGVRCVRMSDGSTLKFYRVTVKGEAVKARKRRAKKVLQRIQREDAAATKRRVRALLVLLGKA